MHWHHSLQSAHLPLLPRRLWLPRRRSGQQRQQRCTREQRAAGRGAARRSHPLAAATAHACWACPRSHARQQLQQPRHKGYRAAPAPQHPPPCCRQVRCRGKVGSGRWDAGQPPATAAPFTSAPPCPNLHHLLPTPPIHPPTPPAAPGPAAARRAGGGAERGGGRGRGEPAGVVLCAGGWVQGAGGGGGCAGAARAPPCECLQRPASAWAQTLVRPRLDRRPCTPCPAASPQVDAHYDKLRNIGEYIGDTEARMREGRWVRWAPRGP